MYIHVSQMRGSTRPVEASFPRPAMDGTEGLGEPVQITGTLRREDDCYRFAGHLASSVGLACAFCNGVFRQALEIDFSLRYTLAGNSPEPSATIPEECELPPDDCDVEALDDEGRIDLMSFTRDQIYLALPLQPRCREDCRGLCRRCGSELNHVTCACSSSEPDPRLAPLAELRNRF